MDHLHYHVLARWRTSFGTAHLRWYGGFAFPPRLSRYISAWVDSGWTLGSAWGGIILLMVYPLAVLFGMDVGYTVSLGQGIPIRKGAGISSLG